MHVQTNLTNIVIDTNNVPFNDNRRKPVVITTVSITDLMAK